MTESSHWMQMNPNDVESPNDFYGIVVVERGLGTVFETVYRVESATRVDPGTARRVLGSVEHRATLGTDQVREAGALAACVCCVASHSVLI